MSLDDASPVPPVHKHEKLPEPPKFHGIRKKDELTASEWVGIMRGYLLMREYQLGSARAIHFAAMFLRGPALTWHLAEGVSLPQKWSSWSEDLLSGVAPTPDDEFAVNMMECIKQTKSMLTYIDEFRKLSIRVPDELKSKHDKVKCFVRGCKPEIRLLLRPAMIGRDRDDLRTCMQLALQFDNDLFQERLAENRSGQPNRIVHKSASTRTGNASSRTCFWCGCADHLIANCPQPPRGDDRSRSKEHRGKKFQKNKSAAKFKKTVVEDAANSDDNSSDGSSNC